MLDHKYKVFYHLAQTPNMLPFTLFAFPHHNRFGKVQPMQSLFTQLQGSLHQL